MVTKHAVSRSRIWPLFAGSALLAGACFTPFLFLKSFDFEILLYLAGIALIALGLGIFDLLRGIFYKSWVKLRSVFAVLMFVDISLTMCHFVYQLRPLARWLVFSSSYQAQVLGQPATGTDGIRFMDWDGWGWAGTDTEVYLVYDPADSLKLGLAQAHGKTARDILANSQFIQRLSPGWYSATLFTNQYLSAEP